MFINETLGGIVSPKSAMPNEIFDLYYYKELWDKSAKDLTVFHNSALFSPFEAVVAGHRFEVDRLKNPNAETAPVDYFVFQLGESGNRAATKIGGLPYLPVNMDWPADEDGYLCQFYAQINFTDSRDIFPASMGDILLLFVSEDPYCEDNFFPVWVEENDKIELVHDAAVECEIQHTLSGHIYRAERFVSEALPKPRACRIEKGASQNVGRVVMETVGAYADRPHPWINRAEAYSREELRGAHKAFFSVGDMGSIMIECIGAKLSISVKSY